MGEIRNTYKIWVGKPKEMRSLGRPLYKQEENIRMELREIGKDHVDWIHLTQDRCPWQALVNTVMNLWVP
jgi:hypothetical protein